MIGDDGFTVNCSVHSYWKIVEMMGFKEAVGVERQGQWKNPFPHGINKLADSKLTGERAS